jgi:hypothetical protein
MINPNIKKQYPVIKMPNGHPISATMYNRNTSQGVVYTNNEEIINTDLAANLSTTSTVVANINITHSIRSDLSATSDLTNATITKVISLQSSISTNNTVSANTLVSKLLASSVTSTGTLAAALTVGGAFDADAQAFFDRVTTDGGTLTTTEKTAVNTLVIGMKADGIWDKMKAIYPMVGASAAACAQNLKSASFTGKFTAGWTFASTGVKPNGINAYMNTFLSPNGNLAQNDAHASMYSRTNSITGNGIDLGCGYTGDNQQFYLSLAYSNGKLISNINGSGFSQGATNTTTLGFFLSQRVSSTSTLMYQNNNQIHSTSTNSNTPTSLSINLGRNNINEYSLREFAFVSFGSSFDTTQRGALNTRVQAFQTTLNRQV